MTARDPCSGRLDPAGRLVEARPMLTQLQTQAGAMIGEPLAVAPIVAVARLAQRMGVPVVRAVRLARADDDLEVRVHAVPGDGGAVDLWLLDAHEVPAVGDLLAGRGTAVALELPVAEGTGNDDWSWRCDAQLRLIEYPAAWAPALPDEPIPATPALTRLVHLEADGQGEMPLLDAIAEGRDFADQPARLRHQPDQWLLLRGTIERDERGEPCGYHGAATRLRAGAHDETESADGPEIEGALHDALLSPLDRIIDAAELIVERGDGPLRRDYANYASDIAAAGRHLLTVIQTMSEEGGEAITRFALGPLVDEVAHLAAAGAGGRGIRIARAAAPASPVEACGMPNAVRQILTNLIGNAIRHSPDGGRIHLDLVPRGRVVAVVVADEGSGIPRGMEEQIFTPYVQGDERQGSAGLGLAIARRLARTMGGDLVLESVAGEGARFALLLPVADA